MHEKPSPPPPNPFPDVPRTPRQHFVLHLYAAVHHLLRTLQATGDESFEQHLENHPFLGEYLVELTSNLSEPLAWAAVPGWWSRALTAWERLGPERLPLRELADGLGLDFPSRIAVVVAGLVEEDSRFGTLFADLQAPLSGRRPTLELLWRAAVAGGAGDGEGETPDPWSLGERLVAAGLVEPVDRGAPRSEWALCAVPALWRVLRGELPGEPLPGCLHRPAETFPTCGELIAEEATLRRATALPALLRSEAARYVVLRCDPGADASELLGAVARDLGRGLLEVERAEALSAGSAAALGPLATALRALPVLRFEPLPGDKIEPPELAGYRGPVALVLGAEGGVSDRVSEDSVALQLPFPGADLRRRMWQRVAADRPFPALDETAERFHLSARFIARVARSATVLADLDGRREVTMADLHQAGSQLNRHLLDHLAERIDGGGDWDDLAVVPATAQQLAGLERRCRHRERVLDRLGPAFRNSANRGVRALFSGPSGTGKTLAARLLASLLEMDLYRVDLAAIVNKYIGETEKNLQQVLARAEALDVVLLLDEGDSLLGGRTEVKSSTDRYANLQTNYLLQRLEHYQGIVLVTTNLGDNIDRAFQRRMDVVVPFFLPGAEERSAILDLHLPDEHTVDGALLDLVALRCDLNGGQLRNVAMQASLLALEDARPVDGDHLEAALRAEYTKAGGTFPLDGRGAEAVNGDGRMDAFVAALSVR